MAPHHKLVVRSIRAFYCYQELATPLGSRFQKTKQRRWLLNEFLDRVGVCACSCVRVHMLNAMRPSVCVCVCVCVHVSFCTFSSVHPACVAATVQVASRTHCVVSDSDIDVGS